MTKRPNRWDKSFQLKLLTDDASLRHEFRVSTGSRYIWNPPLHVFLHRIFLLPVEIRNTCLTEAHRLSPAPPWIANKFMHNGTRITWLKEIEMRFFKLLFCHCSSMFNSRNYYQKHCQFCLVHCSIHLHLVSFIALIIFISSRSLFCSSSFGLVHCSVHLQMVSFIVLFTFKSRSLLCSSSFGLVHCSVHLHLVSFIVLFIFIWSRSLFCSPSNGLVHCSVHLHLVSFIALFIFIWSRSLFCSSSFGLVHCSVYLHLISFIVLFIFI